jgi:hypothetical protein
LIIVAAPLSFAERPLIIAFAARHHEWGNNPNSNLYRLAVPLSAETLSTVAKSSIAG